MGRPDESAEALSGVLRIGPERLASIIEFLPDPTFAIDAKKRVIAWNRACEALTGVHRQAVIGRGDYAYAIPFFGHRRPILIDLLDLPDPETAAGYKYVQRQGDLLYAESFIPHLRDGQGAYVWGVAGPLYDENGHRCGAVEVIRDITERRRIEQALRESEVRYRTLFETASDAILLRRDDRFIDCNPRALALFGCTRDEIIGSTIEALSPPTQPDGVPSADRVRERVQRALHEGPQFFEWRHRRRDGTEFTAEVSLNSLQLDGDTLLQIVIRDITDRRRTEERLEASERRYREVVQLANSIILRWTRDGRVTFLNEYGQRFFGYTEDEIYGQHVVGTIVPESDSQGRDLSSLMARICADPSAFEQNINENMRRNGERVWIAWANRIVFDPDGQVTEILSIGNDITERRRAEEALRELNADLERRVAERTAELAVARDRAEESDRLKSAFLATMSHELRTPLNSIIGFTGILLQELAGPLNDEQRKQLGMVRDSGRHLLALINDVLDISKIEAGRVDVVCEPFDVCEAVQHVTNNVRPLAHKKGIAVECRVDPSLGLLNSDRRRVEQILLNLLGNAVKFTEHGEVCISCAMESGSAVFRVRDTGIGIAPEDIEGLFRPFHQIDTGLTRRHEGTGLGLAICKRLAERLGGTIDVESALGHGSTFTLRLPCSASEAT